MTVDEVVEVDRVLCLVESKGSAVTVGFSMFDSSLMECRLGQLVDDLAMNAICRLIAVLEPLMIVVVAGDGSGGLQKDLECATKSLSIPIKVVPRRMADARQGREMVSAMSVVGSKAVDLEPTLDFYCCASIAALFNFLDACGVDMHVERSIRFVRMSAPETLFMDVCTMKHLELIRSLNMDRGVSLMSIFSGIKTKMGFRYLRMCVMQPSTNVDLIRSRHEAIAWCLMNGHQSLDSLKKLLNTIKGDVAANVASIFRNNRKQVFGRLRAIIGLKRAVDAAVLIGNDLRTSTSELMVKCAMDVESASSIAALLDVLLDGIPEGQLNEFQMCHVIKGSVHSLLDVARQTLDEVCGDVAEYVEICLSDAELVGRLKYTNLHRFVIWVDISKCEAKYDLSGFVSIGNGQYTTMHLMKLNERVLECMDEIMMLSEQVLCNVCEALLDRGSELFAICDAISIVDYICCLAEYALVEDATRPAFSSGSSGMVISNGYHPVLGFMAKRDLGISLKAITMNWTDKFALVIGSNGGGKSTLLRMVALLQIMFQMGSYLPVEYSEMCLVDRIQTRIGSDDDLEQQVSTFGVEMQQVKKIVDAKGERCLVIMDELGRGTSIEEREAISMAVCEDLLESDSMMVMMATHFENAIGYLCNLMGVAVIRMQHHVIFDELVNGSNEDQSEHYGLQAAREMEMDEQVLLDAEGMVMELEDLPGFRINFGTEAKNQLILTMANEAMSRWKRGEWDAMVDGREIKERLMSGLNRL